MFDSFFLLVIWNSAIAALMAAIVLLLARFSFIGRRPVLLRSLWGLVLVKLVTPPLIPLPLLSPEPRSEDAATQLALYSPALDQDAANSFVQHPLELPHADQDAHSVGAEALRSQERFDSEMVLPATKPMTGMVHGGSHAGPRDPAIEKREPASINGQLQSSLWWIGITTWLVVSSLLLLRLLIQARSLQRLIRHAPPGEARLCQIVNQAACRFGIRRIETRVAEGRFPPLIWTGWFTVTIVFPSRLVRDLETRALKGVVYHELAHFLHRDQHWNLFARIVSSMFWWHPVAWIASGQLKKLQEICADEFAIENSRVGRKKYLQTLFQVMLFARAESVKQPGLASGFGTRSSIESRFEILANGEQINRMGLATRVAILVCFLASFCLPVAARSGTFFPPQESKQETDEPVAMKRQIRLEGIMTRGTHRSSFSPDGKYLAVGAGEQANSKIYRVSDGQAICEFETDSQSVFDVEFTADGKGVISSCRNGIFLSDAKTGARKRRFLGHTSTAARELDLSHDGKWLASGSTNRADAKTDAAIRIWEVETAKHLHVIQLLGEKAIQNKRRCMINSLEFSPDKSRVLVSVGYYNGRGIEIFGMVCEYEIATGKLVRALCCFGEEHMATFLDQDKLPGEALKSTKSRVATYSPDGRFIATGHEAEKQSGRFFDDPENCAIRFWDTKTGKVVASLKGHRSNVVSLEFSGDSKRLVSCSWDQYRRGKAVPSLDHSVRVWDVANQKEIASIQR